MDPNVRTPGRGPPNSAGASSHVDTPPLNPSLSSAWAQGVNSLDISQSQNVNNQFAGGRNVSVYVNCSDAESAQITNPQQEDFDDITMTARADHEIYSSQLLTKKRGYPLWVPGPGMQLPIEYRRQGISIGDVGIITSTEGFDFLFNIFLPADHPINDGMVPQGFSPLPRQELERDIQRTAGYGPNTHLASASVRKISAHLISETLGSIDHRFESTAKEAAILVMPDGATTQNLRNTRGVRAYISKKARDWYTYATETRGREVKNGDVRVVVGVDKVPSWGIATSACNLGQTASYVFKHDPTYTYKWDCTGGSGRVGPLKVETRDLMEDSDSSPLENQCVFVRTINFTLSGKIRSDFPSESAVKQSGSGSGKSQRDSSSGNRGSRGTRGSSGRNSSRHQLGSTQGTLCCTQSVIFDPVELGVNHPSTALHNRLHEQFPGANIVITEDIDWISVLNDDDVVFPEPDELCARILEAHELRTHQDVVYLLRKHNNESQLRTRTDISEHKSINARIAEAHDTIYRDGKGKEKESENLSAHDPPRTDENQDCTQVRATKSLDLKQEVSEKRKDPPVSYGTKRLITKNRRRDVFRGSITSFIDVARGAEEVIGYCEPTYIGNSEDSIESSQVPGPRHKTRTQDERYAEDDKIESESESLGGGGARFYGEISGFVRQARGPGNAIALKKVTYTGTSRENDSRGQQRPYSQEEIAESRNIIRGLKPEPMKMSANNFPRTMTERQQLEVSDVDMSALMKEFPNVSPKIQRYITSLIRQGRNQLEDRADSQQEQGFDMESSTKDSQKVFPETQQKSPYMPATSPAGQLRIKDGQNRADSRQELDFDIDSLTEEFQELSLRTRRNAASPSPKGYPLMGDEK